MKSKVYKGCAILVIYICIKFQVNISNNFEVTEWTQIYYRNHFFSKLKGP